MLSALTVVFPVFALIFVGWLVRRGGILGAQATTEMNRFVVYLALPALLFDIVAHADWADIWKPGFIATFGLSCFVVFGLTLLVRWRGSHHLADAAIDGLNAGYANTGFMGIPLVLLVLGQEAMPSAMIVTIFTACILFAVAIIAIEIGLQAEGSPLQIVWKVVRSLSRNPLIIAPVLGSVIPLSGLTIPAPGETFLKLLAGTAAPCALVTLGLFLAEKRDSAADPKTTTLLVILKLIVQPLIAWVLAVHVFHLPPLLVHSAVLFAALPTGTGPFMLAELYRRDAAITSTTILVSTIFSVLTITAYLAVAL
ncbi:MAG: AEC family transporter [Xanthobacteraceae bacterium]|nr:AEC family transporter [Xanthobacteraceae bacterium]